MTEKRGARRVPKCFINTAAVADMADKEGFYTVGSEAKRAMVYIFDGEDVLLVTFQDGYLRGKIDDILDILEEFEEIVSVLPEHVLDAANE